MNARVLCTVVVTCLLLGCSQKTPTAADELRGPAWPLTKEQRAKLGKMSRAEREAWLEEFGLPEYEARKLKGKLTIDGVLDEADWQRAQTVSLLTTSLGRKPKLKTAARMLWDDEAIYLAFACDDPDVHAPLTKHDDDLWKHDLVEVFVDVDGNANQYLELHAAPSGALADVIWADFDPKTDWFTAPGWKHFKLSTCKGAITVSGMQVAVKVNGTLNEPDDTDKGYVVEWRIPFAGLRKVVPDVTKSKPWPIDMTRFEQIPVKKPTVGTVWRMNFNRCDDSTKMITKNRKGKDVVQCEYTAWSPPIRSNHMPFRFGKVTFVE